MYLLTIIVHHPLHLLGDFIVTGGDEWHLRYLEGMDGDGIIIDADICHTMPCINHGGALALTCAGISFPLTSSCTAVPS